MLCVSGCVGVCVFQFGLSISRLGERCVLEPVIWCVCQIVSWCDCMVTHHLPNQVWTPSRCRLFWKAGWERFLSSQDACAQTWLHHTDVPACSKKEAFQAPGAQQSLLENSWHTPTCLSWAACWHLACVCGRGGVCVCGCEKAQADLSVIWSITFILHYHAAHLDMCNSSIYV